MAVETADLVTVVPPSLSHKEVFYFMLVATFTSELHVQNLLSLLYSNGRLFQLERQTTSETPQNFQAAVRKTKRNKY